MLKKIQQYLLLHYPLAWNLRLGPMLLILLALHALFFFTAYSLTDASFSSSHYHYAYYWMEEHSILFILSILAGVLLLTGWLVFYNKNNGFRTFYPRKTIHVYFEWLMIFLITTGIALIPVSLIMGDLGKWQSVASESNAQKAMDVLQKAAVLIPEASYNYIVAVDDADSDTLNLRQYSLLSYSESSDDDYYDESKSELRAYNNRESVRRWLRNEEKDSIYAVMVAFDHLMTKHRLTAGITPEQWFQRIYNPPAFPVRGSTMIMDQTFESDYTAEEFDVDHYIIRPEDTIGVVSVDYIPHLPLSVLKNTYRHVLKSYEFDESFLDVILFCLSTSLFISCLIFSFRITNGKSWLTAFIATGIMIFITFILIIIFGILMSGAITEIASCALLAWIALFIIILVKIADKIQNRSGKGRSGTHLNLFIWLIPCMIPLLYFSFCIQERFAYSQWLEEEKIRLMFWINLPVVVLFMCLAASLVRKWKSLGES